MFRTLLRKGLNSTVEDLFAKLHGRLLRRGIKVFAERLAALLILLQRLKLIARERVKPHQLSVNLFVRRIMCNKFFEALDTLLMLVVCFIKLSEINQKIPV